MISCHYDGVPYGPAASDDGISFATMLEMAFVLSSSSSSTKLNRDVLFLFVDAEEVGLVGAFEGDSSNNSPPHPWSLLPSIVLNLDNSAVCGKQMLLGANSRYGAEAYFTYAPHPKAFSFTEWFNVNLDIGENDAVVYARSGLHTLDFGCPENRLAYHSINDDIEHVWAGSLQHMGENTLAVVKGIAAEDEESFPRRMEEHDSSTSASSSSGLTYFTLMGGTVISVSANTATIGFTTLAAVMALTMPLIVHYTKPKAESRQ